MRIRPSSIRITLIPSGPVLAALLLSSGPADAREIKMPTRGYAFATQDTYMVTSGHAGYNCSAATPEAQRRCELDIIGLRWDGPSQNWTRSRTQPNTPTPWPFSDDVMWGLPLYSPVDGEIVGCWKRMPDDDVDGDDVNCPGGTGTCAQGGNHLNILTADGELVFFGHLQADSIPDELCPINDVYLYDTDPKTCTLGGNWTGLRQSSILPAPIPVRKGDFIGRVGTSGQGVGVHLHTHITPHAFDGANHCEGPFRPIEFAESWYQRRSVGVEPAADDWVALEGDLLPIDGSDLVLWPDPVGPRQDEVTIESGTMPALAVTGGGGVLAFRNAGQNLAVVAFERNAVDLSIGPQRVEGQVIPYFVTATENLVRGIGYASAGTIVQAEATRSPVHDGVVVAFRNASNGLSVTDLSVSLTAPEELTAQRHGTATSSSAVSDLDVATVVAGRGVAETNGAFRGVITAERRTSDDAMVVRSWRIATNGTVTLIDSEVARNANNAVFAVGDVDVSVVGSSVREFAVVSARLAGNDELRVQTWEITSSGQLFRREQSDAGEIGALASAKAGTQDAVTAVESGAGDLLAVSWNVSPVAAGVVGGALRRVGTRIAGTISQIAAAADPDGDDLILAVRDSANEIGLLYYWTNYDPNL